MNINIVFGMLMYLDSGPSIDKLTGVTWAVSVATAGNKDPDTKPSVLVVAVVLRPCNVLTIAAQRARLVLPLDQQ
jgi:hypothetical protein